MNNDTTYSIPGLEDLYKQYKTEDYHILIKKLLQNLKKVEKFHVSSFFTNYTISLKEPTRIVPAGSYQLENTTYRGKSVNTVRQIHTGTFVALAQYLALVAAVPSIIDHKVYLDFPADDLRFGSDWSYCPHVRQYVGEAWLYGYGAGNANGKFGSLVCAGSTTGTLNNEQSSLFDPLTLDRIETKLDTLLSHLGVK